MFDIPSILTLLKRTFTRRDVLIILGLILLYFITRLINLDKFPIFSDEGIYIHWSKVAWHDASWRFISLTDGKQPLQTWGTIPFLKLFSDNLLLGGRLFAVSTGFLALSGMFSFLWYLFGKKAAFWGSLLYTLTPYFLFYDRLALVDSGVNAGFIWILFLSIVLARSRRLDIALLFGIVGGMAMLAKSSVRIFIGLSILAPILFLQKKQKTFFRNLLNYLFLYTVGGAIALVIYNIQRLSPFFHYVAEKNFTFVMTFAEFKANPFAVFFTNIRLIPLYVLQESGFVLGVIALIGYILLFKKDRRLFWYLTAWIVAPFLVVLFLSKVLFPRYIIFFPSLLVILATAFFTYSKNKRNKMIMITAFLLSVAYFNYTILFSPAYVPLPEVDRGQYIEGWPAGWGAKEIVQFAREKSAEKPVILLAEGNFGMSADVLDTFLKPQDTISIRGYWPLSEAQLKENQKDLDKYHIYAVFHHTEVFPKEWPIKLIKKYEKPNNKSALYLYELTR